MANFEDFIGFLEEENKIKAAKEVRRSNSNPRRPISVAVNDGNISSDDVKTNFNDLYKLKENNLATEIELNGIALQINKQQQTIAKATQKETIGLTTEEVELNNKHKELSTKQETLKNFKELQFSKEEEPLLKEKFLKLRHFKTIETRYQNGELSQNKLRARVEVLDDLRAEVRQLRTHAMKKIDDSKQKLEEVNVKIKELDLKTATESKLPKESIDQLNDLKNEAVILTEVIKKSEAIVITIDAAMSDKKDMTIEQSTLEAKIIEKQPVDIAKSSKVETVRPEVARTLHTPEKNQSADVSKSSKVETANPEVAEKLQTPKEKHTHVFADVLIKNRENEIPEQERKVSQPSEDIKAKSDSNPAVEPKEKPESKLHQEEPDSGTAKVPTDLTPELKKAVIENLQASKALSELSISKKQELLDTLKNTKVNKPLIENLSKEIEEDKKNLAGIEKTLKNPEKLVDKLKEKIDVSSSPTGLQKVIDLVKEDTEEIKKETNRLEKLTLPELKKGFLTPSRGFKWGRRLLHLWPFAMIPLVIAAATMILTPVMFVAYGVPLIAVLSTAIVASYAIPKGINYVRARRAERKQKQNIQKIRESPEKTQELAQEKQQDVKKEQTQEQTKEKIQNPRSNNTKTNSQSKSAQQNNRSEGIEQKTAVSQANSLENQDQEQSKLSRRARVARFAKKNWKPLAIMVGGSLLIGVAGVFLLPAVAPGLAAGVSIAALFTIGSTAMIGAGTSIGAQLLDRFGLKRAEDHLKNKENEKIHAQAKEYKEKLGQNLSNKDQNIVRSAVVEEIKENTVTSKDQSTHVQTSGVRNIDSIQTIPVVHNQSRQNSVRNNIIPLNSPHAGQQEPSAQRRHSFAAATEHAKAKAENVNNENKVQRSQSLRILSSADKARTQSRT